MQKFRFVVLPALLLCAVMVQAQPDYRTFNQLDLAQKKASKAGKPVSSQMSFVFHNTMTATVSSLHIRFTSQILSLADSGGFPTVIVGRKQFDGSGRQIAPGDSAVIVAVFAKKELKTRADQWWWDSSGVRVGGVNKNLAGTGFVIYGQPNGGTVREFLYKRVITRPAGLVVGIPTDTPGVGWIRYMKDDRKYFPQFDSSRCFDLIQAGMGNTHPFVGELKNPHVNKYDNHLLGEVHALKLAIIANDSGVSEPDTPATRLGDLLYNDASNLSDPCNGLTVRGIVHLVDSALTYCGHFGSGFYFEFDSCVSRINRAFDGPYTAVSFSPFKLAGTNPLPAFLHPNPAAPPVVFPSRRFALDEDAASAFALAQNYPNPFNPTTTITFTLPAASAVTLKVYNILGQEVATLMSLEPEEGGEHSVEFNAGQLTSGIYFYSLQAGSLRKTKMMMLVK